MAILLGCVSIICVIVGVIGTVMPIMPGVLLVFTGLWLAAWGEHFIYVGWRTLTVLGVLTVLAYGVDFFATIVGAKRFGASHYAVTGSAVGTLVGFFFGVPGIVLGPFIGAVAGELFAHGNLEKAVNTGIGATLGLALGAAVKLALVMMMIGLFAVVRFVS